MERQNKEVVLNVAIILSLVASFALGINLILNKIDGETNKISKTKTYDKNKYYGNQRFVKEIKTYESKPQKLQKENIARVKNEIYDEEIKKLENEVEKRKIELAKKRQEMYRKRLELEKELKSLKQNIEFEYPQTVDRSEILPNEGENDGIEPEEDLNINSKIAMDLSSRDINKRKSIFDEMIKAHQNAFCSHDTKYVKLPEDLFEKTSKTLKKKGPSTITIDAFIQMNYANASIEQKTALKEVLEGMNELTDDIRQWDISKSLLSYCILKSSDIELTRENIIKAQKCINFKWELNEVVSDFYREFGINPSYTNEILTALCGNDWNNYADKVFVD